MGGVRITEFYRGPEGSVISNHVVASKRCFQGLWEVREQEGPWNLNTLYKTKKMKTLFAP